MLVRSKILSVKRLSYTLLLLIVVVFLHFALALFKNAPLSWNIGGELKKIPEMEAAPLPIPAPIYGNELGTAAWAKTPKELPWFFKSGTKYPGKEDDVAVPSVPDGNDGIVQQLMFVPSDYGESSRERLLLVYHGTDGWVKGGKESFRGCPVDKCVVSTEKSDAEVADAILFKDHLEMPLYTRPFKQIWIMHMLESPIHTSRLPYNDVVNWTATYRRDSDIVTPYERWVYYDESVKSRPQTKNYAFNKTKQVAWFVSNCGAKNGRLDYARRLSEHIGVDIYGHCGDHRCPRQDPQCFQMLESRYKFYLAFENSNCADYITEKFFVNGLQHDVLPIAMGARPRDYEAVAPLHSYIHVDDFPSPRHLAAYLLRLDKDDDAYNAYFRWKGTGEFIDTRFLCRLCASLHGNTTAAVKTYPNFNRWWRDKDTCISNGPWPK